MADMYEVSFIVFCEADDPVQAARWASDRYNELMFTDHGIASGGAAVVAFNLDTVESSVVMLATGEVLKSPEEPAVYPLGGGQLLTIDSVGEVVDR